MKQHIKQVLTRELKRLEPVTVWQNADGSYDLFGAYRLTSTDQGFTVVKQDRIEVDFCARRSAVAWCIADQHGDRNLAREVRMLDAVIDRVRTDIDLRGKIKGDHEFRQVISVKLQPKLVHCRQLENELDRCVRLAKRYQRGLIK